MLTKIKENSYEIFIIYPLIGLVYIIMTISLVKFYIKKFYYDIFGIKYRILYHKITKHIERI